MLRLNKWRGQGAHHEEGEDRHSAAAPGLEVHAERREVVAHQLHARVDPAVQPVLQHAGVFAGDDAHEGAAEHAVAVEVPAQHRVT